MKQFKLIALMSMFFVVNNVWGQEQKEIDLADSTGLPGDNFSLQGALGLFKESKSLEDFEKRLNTKDNDVNNLDLNGDGKTDYVKVNTISKDDVHAVILQVPVSKTENQDLAVIEIEKQGDASAMVQIIGDKELYPENTIVEPAGTSEPADPGNSKRGPSAFSMGTPFVFVNVWGWPCVQFMFAPAFVGWVSPWYWGYYPMWWSPWPVYPWRYHYMSCYHYHDYYHHSYYHRTTYAHEVYAPRRTHSTAVTERYRESHVRYNANATSRPRPDAVTGRPTRPGNTVSRPNGMPSSRPQTKPATQPGKQPAVRPSTQDERPPARPSAQPGKQPQVKPSTRPDNYQQSRPSTPPVKQPQVRPSKPPVKQPQVKQPAVRPQQNMQSRPAPKQSAPSKPMNQSKPSGGKHK